MRLYLLVMPDALTLPKHDMNKHINVHAKIDGKNPRATPAYIKNCRKLQKDENERNILPREEHTNWLPGAKSPTLKPRAHTRACMRA